MSLESDLLCFCLFTDFERERDRVSCLLFLVRDMFQCLELDLDRLFGRRLEDGMSRLWLDGWWGDVKTLRILLAFEGDLVCDR